MLMHQNSRLRFQAHTFRISSSLYHSRQIRLRVITNHMTSYHQSHDEQQLQRFTWRVWLFLIAIICRDSKSLARVLTNTRSLGPPSTSNFSTVLKARRLLIGKKGLLSLSKYWIASTVSSLQVLYALNNLQKKHGFIVRRSSTGLEEVQYIMQYILYI